MADSFTKESSVDPSLGLAPRSLPREAILSTVPGSSLSATKKIVNVVPITANTIGPSQTLQFLMPQRNFAKANSVYLKFRFTATGGSSSQLPWSFSGGMQSAGSLFNNISLQAGGVILESMQNYHAWHNNCIEWMHSADDLLKIESLCSGSRLPENLPVGGQVLVKFTGTGASVSQFVFAPGSSPTASMERGLLRNVQPGMVIVGGASTSAAGSPLVYTTTAPTQSAVVTSVDYASGVVLFSPAITTVTDGLYTFTTAPGYPTQQLYGYNSQASSTTGNFTNFVNQDAYDGANPNPSGLGTRKSLMQFAGSSSGSAPIEIVFSIPLYCGFFNPKESQLIPLEFINGGVLITLQTNPVTKAFWTEVVPTAATGFLTYTLSDFELCYTEIAPTPDFLMDVRMDLSKNKFIKIETQSYQNFLLSAGQQGNTRQMFNANLSSLSCMLFGRMVDSDDWTTPKMFQWVGHDSNTQIRYEVYFDNILMFNSANQLTDISVVVRQLQEALGSSITDYITTPACSGRGLPVKVGNPASSNIQINYNTYCGGHALMGLSTRVFSSNSTSMDGTPVGTITINFYNNDGETNTNLWYFYLVYDYIYTIDASGSVEKVQ